MIRGIIFDMDGVLADTEGFYAERRDNFLLEKGMKQLSGIDFTGSNERAIWETLVPEDPQLRESLKLEYRSYQKTHTIPYPQLVSPHVFPLFTALKKRGLRLAIASSSDRGSIHAMMKAANIEALVDFYISGEDCTEHKPSPEIYQHALAALKLHPDEAFAVEDSTPGIAAAKNAGLQVLALFPSSGATIDQSAADKIIYTLPQVLDIVDDMLADDEETNKSTYHTTEV